MKKLTILFIASCICSMLNCVVLLIKGNWPAAVGWFVAGLAVCLLFIIICEWNGLKARYEAEIAKYKRDLVGRGTPRESSANKYLSNKRDANYAEKLARGEYGSPSRNQEGDPVIKKNLTTDREYWRRVYAGQAMQGLCVNIEVTHGIGFIAEWAIRIADAILAELEKTEKK